MSTTKDKAIRKIADDFESLSKLTLQQMELLAKVIASEHTNISTESLKQIRKNERKIDTYEIKISNRIISTIVLYKPVASELRRIMASYRMITNLERIGDLIMKIVNVLKNLKDPGLLLLNSKDISEMLAVSTEMISKAIFSFTDNDKEAALWTINSDSFVDNLNRQILKNSILAEKSSGKLQKVILNFIGIKSIISSIERIADHAAHIAEASIFAYEGTDIRHQSLQKG
ncbi:MAG: phosphate transport system regulatory protein PhoU [bacterium]|nr:MAG: phosphate transport system regulatory protein PhoU [bacterium]